MAKVALLPTRFPFAPSFVVSTGSVIGDFNRDGILDFALPGITGSLGNLQNVMQIYLGNGDGTPSARP